MNEEEDRIWLDTLAGRGTAGDETMATREAGSLREQLLARTGAGSPGVPERDPSREAALLSRARREGLIAAAPRRPSESPRWRAALAVAAMLGVGVLVGSLVRPGREPETVRAGPGEIVRLQAEDPGARARALQADLRTAGVEAAIYERLGLQGIDADLPRPLPFAVRSILQRYGIPEPRDGVLRVEIEEATSP